MSLISLWNNLLIAPLTTALLFFYETFGQNLGIAIIVLTLVLRVILFPLALPALRSAKLQKEIKPALDKIKKKFKKDRQGLAKAQMELFRKKGVNPLAGCLPQIIQLIVLIALYRVFIDNLTGGGFNPQFLIWDLSLRDPYLILPILAAAAQFLLSRMMLPGVSEEHEAAHKTKEKEKDFAAAFQKQNLYLFPIFTLILGFQFQAGYMLYWLTSTVLQIFQQWLAVRIL
ncbi:MAG: YidC family membrane integrase SpoIIIJ [Patescibacteria group bacterium]|nr:MAG: YidC family membrane integrase SpoIIIJ [Patescibacteria group bacterium]